MYNFIAIYRILSYLEQALDYDEPDMSQISSSALGLSANRWLALLRLLEDAGYIEAFGHRTRITLRGLEYLQQNAKQSFVAKPGSPLVTLTTGSVNRSRNPPVKIIEGTPVAFYPASVPVQIDLFTHGRQEEVAPGFTPIAENTAEDDMLAFGSFLNSPFVTQWCHQHDIAIVVPTAVQDLTDLVHDTNYEFRAMLEIAVYFTMTAIGITGTLDIDSVKHSDGEDDIQADDVINIEPQVTPTPSGGGSSEMTAHEGEYFTNAEINNRPVKEEKDI